MLVLSRKAGETVIVGDEIVVTVLESRDNRVKLGIDAPKSISVHREEVYLRTLAKKGVVNERRTSLKADEKTA